MKNTPLEQRIISIITPVAEDLGFNLVSVKLLGDKGQTLQIMAENPETKGLNIDECAKLSREISTLLDVEDPIRGAYRLEISSPGIDRPLTKMQDFLDYMGFEAKIEIEPPLEGQKRFRGHLKGAENNTIIIDTDQGEYALPYETVQKAKLVLTDELINKTKRAN